MNFLNIKNAVAAQFNAMTVSGHLFLTNVSKDESLASKSLEELKKLAGEL